MSAGGDELTARAARLHRDAVVVDTHADTPTEFFLQDGYDFAERHEVGHVDLYRLREGGVDLQFLAAWVPAEYAATRGASYRHALTLIDAIHRVVDRTPGARIARDGREIREIHARGDVALMIGVEGGHAIENTIEKLRILHRKGARYLTLTWNNTHDWADAAGDEPRHGGLTPFGREVVREMNRLRMIIDVSHVANTTFWHVLEESSAPVIASHSCARAQAEHFRNLDDEQLRALAAAGGVVGVNAFPTFLDTRFAEAFTRIEERAEALERDLRTRYRDPQRARQEARTWMAAAIAELPPVPIDRLVDHIDHIVQTAGIDHVGLGCDFDGIPCTPEGLEDVAAIPRITELLLRRGYDDDDVKKILGENFLRIIDTVIG